MSKFKVGDKARYIAYPKDSFKEIPLGSIVIVTSIGEMGRGMTTFPHEHDYGIAYDGFDIYVCYEWQLEPIIDLGSWDEIEDSIGWNPTKEKEGQSSSSSQSATILKTGSSKEPIS